VGVPRIRGGETLGGRKSAAWRLIRMGAIRASSTKTGPRVEIRAPRGRLTSWAVSPQMGWPPWRLRAMSPDTRVPNRGTRVDRHGGDRTDEAWTDMSVSVKGSGRMGNPQTRTEYPVPGSLLRPPLERVPLGALLRTAHHETLNAQDVRIEFSEESPRLLQPSTRCECLGQPKRAARRTAPDTRASRTRRTSSLPIRTSTDLAMRRAAVP